MVRRIAEATTVTTKKLKKIMVEIFFARLMGSSFGKKQQLMVGSSSRATKLFK